MRALGEAFTTRPVLALALAARAALAAVLAWVIVAPFDGVADQYAYYAPFGAVVVVSTTVMGSLRTSAEVFLALTVGASLGLVVQALSLPSPLAVGLVVGIGTLLSPLRWLGAMGSWAPISALFVLILGAGQPENFVAGYLGLTSLGAMVGTAVNLLMPPLHFVATERAQESLREALVTQLDVLAERLDEQSPADDATVLETPERLRRRGLAVEDLAAQALGGPRVNWRLLRRQERANRVQERGSALAALALAVGGIVDTLDRQAGPHEVRAPWRSPLGEPTARALRATAEVLRAVDQPEGRQRYDEARDLVDALARAVPAVPAAELEDRFAAGSLVLGLRRTLDAVEPTAG